MEQRKRLRSRRSVRVTATILLAVTAAAAPWRAALALITGGEGDKPLADPGWPKGAAAIFNHPSRIAWWEGPPFGGGQWHAECRGDAEALSAVLADFARLDVKTKRLVVHDGVGHSFWLNPNRDPARRAAAEIDWVFIVWQPASWDRLRELPANLNPTDSRDAEAGPPAQIDVYTGGNIRWSDVNVPEGLEVVDKRLEAHGFTPEDGIVLEGKVVDLATGRPVAAQMQLQEVQRRQEGGYRYSVVAEADADEEGRWVLKNAPPGWRRVVVRAEGYIPRVVGYDRFDDQPRWSSYDCGLSRPASLSGRITDEEGQPLADVDVRLKNVVAEKGQRYESPQEYRVKTGADGRFHFKQVPTGGATIRLHKAGYCRPGLGQPVDTPAEDIELTMIQSASVQVTVDFAGTDRPAGYIVHMEPEDGAAVGKWSGSGNIDAENQITFENIPPGRYVLRGQPNPGSASQQTKPLTIELQGGQAAEITLPAR